MSESFSVVRNGVTKNMVLGTFGKKSDLAGTQFPYPVISPETFDQDEIWIGVSDMCSSLTTWLRRVFADIYVDCRDEKTGIFNRAQWDLDAADFTAGVAKMSDIKEALEELFEKQSLIVADDNFGAEVDIKDENGETKSVKTPEAQELEAQMRTNNDKIKPLKAQLAAITAKYAERAEKREKSKAAKEAAAAAAKANS